MSEKFGKASAVTSDEQIVELYLSRNENAIVETEVKYGKMLFRIAYNILHDRLDCEECKNDTYLAVWHAIPPAKPSVFPAFITQIMRNIATKRYKAKTSLKRIPAELTVSTEELEELLHDENTPPEEYNAKELGKLISNYLRTLSDRQQYIFIGRFYMAETIEHLAGRLNIGVATVHRETEKIKQGLKKYLKKNGVYV